MFVLYCCSNHYSIIYKKKIQRLDSERNPLCRPQRYLMSTVPRLAPSNGVAALAVVGMF